MKARTTFLPALLAAGVVSIFGGGAAISAGETRPDIILITIDTLRADRLGCYGYDRSTSPHIDRVAETGVLFEKAWSTANWTKPAMASLITSLDPLRHMVRRGTLRDGRREGAAEEILDRGFITLAEALEGSGHRSFGFSSNPFLTLETGFGQGFDVFEQFDFADGSVVRDAVFRHIPAMKSSRPYFAWIHFVDPHEPYPPRDPEERSTAEKEIGCSGECFEKRFHKRLARATRASDPAIRERALDRLQRLYDEQIRYTDELVGELLSRLPRADSALLIVTSDHGEQFLEHGELGHRQGMFEEEVAVPLILRFPGRLSKGRRVSTPVSILDVGPTLLELAGSELPPSFTGRSLSEVAATGGSSESRELFAECAAPEDRHIAVWREGRWKYMVHLSENWEKLFDLEIDPFETNDVAAEEPERLKRMRNQVWSRYEDYKERRKAAPTREIDPELLEMLESLGYIETNTP